MTRRSQTSRSERRILQGDEQPGQTPETGMSLESGDQLERRPGQPACVGPTLAYCSPSALLSDISFLIHKMGSLILLTVETDTQALSQVGGPQGVPSVLSLL